MTSLCVKNGSERTNKRFPNDYNLEDKMYKEMGSKSWSEFKENKIF